jgi:hypothetical protein
VWQRDPLGVRLAGRLPGAGHRPLAGLDRPGAAASARWFVPRRVAAVRGTAAVRRDRGDRGVLQLPLRCPAQRGGRAGRLPPRLRSSTARRRAADGYCRTGAAARPGGPQVLRGRAGLGGARGRGRRPGAGRVDPPDRDLPRVRGRPIPTGPGDPPAAVAGTAGGGVVAARSRLSGAGRGRLRIGPLAGGAYRVLGAEARAGEDRVGGRSYSGRAEGGRPARWARRRKPAAAARSPRRSAKSARARSASSWPGSR